MLRCELKELCLEITNLCLMSCIHCSSFNGFISKEDDEMNLSGVKKIIDEFVKTGGTVLEISGGEPLMHSKLLEIISYANKKHLETILYTSGLIFQHPYVIRPITISLARKFRKAGLKKIIFNLEGANKETHEYITRTPDSFEGVIKSIQSMKAEGFWVGVHFVPMKPNFRELEKIVQLCYVLNIDEIGILRFVPQGRGRTNRQLLELTINEFEKVVKEMVKLKHQFKKPLLRIGRPFNFCSLFYWPSEIQMCDAGKTKCLIKPNGDVVPCPAFKQNPEFIAGNVKNESLINIWNNSQVWELFRHFNYEQLSEPCKTCYYLPHCQGRCHAQRILSYGNIYYGPDPHCFICKPEREAYATVI